MTTLQTAPFNAGLAATEPTISVSTSGSPTVTTPLIYLLEDDPLMAKCLSLSCRQALSAPPEIKTFTDAIGAMAALDQGLPDLILLDIILNGPDGFTFLNELMSYSDTAVIPVILITSLQLHAHNLEHYGVREILSKETLTPASLATAVRRYV